MDPLTLIMLAVLAMLIFFMARNSKKRKADTALLQEKMVPGAEIMTNFGLFGTLLSIDDENNVAVIETAPGTTIRVHRQTLARVLDDNELESTSEVDEAPESASPESSTSTTPPAND
jgi:preprotein translocase subunit YajC